MRVRFSINSEVAAEFSRFLIVGLTNTALTLGIIFVLLWIGASLVVANIMGYTAGFINSFIWNRRWTFRSGGKVWREMVVYTLVWIASYLLQIGALLISSRWVGLSDAVSTLVAMAFFTGPNYLGNRWFTFRKE